MIHINISKFLCILIFCSSFSGLHSMESLVNFLTKKRMLPYDIVLFYLPDPCIHAISHSEYDPYPGLLRIKNLLDKLVSQTNDQDIEKSLWFLVEQCESPVQSILALPMLDKRTSDKKKIKDLIYLPYSFQGLGDIAAQTLRKNILALYFDNPKSIWINNDSSYKEMLLQGIVLLGFCNKPVKDYFDKNHTNQSLLFSLIYEPTFFDQLDYGNKTVKELMNKTEALSSTKLIQFWNLENSLLLTTKHGKKILELWHSAKNSLMTPCSKRVGRNLRERFLGPLMALYNLNKAYKTNLLPFDCTKNVIQFLGNINYMPVAMKKSNSWCALQ